MTRFASKARMPGDRSLRRDIRLLGWIMRGLVKEEYGRQLWAQVLQLRACAGRHEAGDPAADSEMRQLVAGLPLVRLESLLHVLGLFFDLANISEDRHRERVLAYRRSSGTLQDSFSNRLNALAELEPDAQRRRAFLAELHAEFVFTAHPTEAKRQAVRRVLQRLRDDLERLDQSGEAASGRRSIIDRMREDLRMLVRVDPLHPHRPTVLEELDRALFSMQALWSSVPLLGENLAQAGVSDARPVSFGCWIGGDRDGHPYVTVEVTEQTLQRLQQTAKRMHLSTADAFARYMVALCRSESAIEQLNQVVEWGQSAQLEQALARLHPEEHFRRALKAIRLRLGSDGAEGASPVYRSGAELIADIQAVLRAAEADGFGDSLLTRLRAWLSCARVFGLHGMRLDIRENSQGFRTLVREVLPLLGRDPECEAQNRFEDLWVFPFQMPDWEETVAQLSERSRDLLSVLRLFQERAQQGRQESLGGTIISMTHTAEDVLWVLWLHRLAARWLGLAAHPLDVVPLFETIDDLQAAPEILSSLFSHAEFAVLVSALQQRQVVMVGYSDSAKDGGYLSACWALFQGQQAMQAVGQKAGVDLVFFHGRGGALGRGGGPAARAIESLPPLPGDAHIRMTEQGEVIADRFADPELAHRHMEQILGGLIRHAQHRAEDVPPDGVALMNRFAEMGRQAYRALFEHEGFSTYFRQATPIVGIEQLPIGSRPSRRSGKHTLDDLRAIPYTFSWTQSRQLINAFYGLGHAWTQLAEEDRTRACVLYEQWGFFRSMIDNAELALAKCDTAIVKEYARLVNDQTIGQYFSQAVVEEIQRTQQAVLEITGQQELLERVPWLQRSVDVRKPYIDILNHIQIELLQRHRSPEGEQGRFDRALRLSIQALAAGLRSTG